MSDVDDDPEVSELESGESGAIVAAPRTHHATTLSGLGEAADLEQYAAVEAAKHLDDALKTLVAVMRNPNRNAQVQLMACREVINLALKRSPEAVSKQGTKVYVLDRAEAGRVLAKRLGLQE